MPTRSFSDLAAGARAKWSPSAVALEKQLGNQLEAEIDSQLEFGREMRKAREAAKLSQPGLAKLAAVQQADISRIERGLGNPTSETLTRIANALGMRLTLKPIE